MMANVAKVLGEIDVRKAGTILKSRMFYTRKTAGKRDRSEAGAPAKGACGNGSNAFRNGDRSNTPTIGKSVRAYLGETTGKNDGVETGTMVESQLADCLKTLGEIDARETKAIEESIRMDGGQRAGQRSRKKCYAAIESVGTDVRHRGRNSDGSHVLTTIKRGGADGSNGICDVVERDTVGNDEVANNRFMGSHYGPSINESII